MVHRRGFSALRRGGGFVLLASLGCASPAAPTDVQAPSSTTAATITAREGGSLRSADGLFTLHVPAGALVRDTRISVRRLSSAELPSEVQAARPVAGVYAVEPDGLRFQGDGAFAVLELPSPPPAMLGDDPMRAYPMLVGQSRAGEGGSIELHERCTTTYDLERRAARARSRLRHLSLHYWTAQDPNQNELAVSIAVGGRYHRVGETFETPATLTWSGRAPPPAQAIVGWFPREDAPVRALPTDDATPYEGTFEQFSAPLPGELPDPVGHFKFLNGWRRLVPLAPRRVLAIEGLRFGCDRPSTNDPAYVGVAVRYPWAEGAAGEPDPTVELQVLLQSRHDCAETMPIPPRRDGGLDAATHDAPPSDAPPSDASLDAPRGDALGSLPEVALPPADRPSPLDGMLDVPSVDASPAADSPCSILQALCGSACRDLEYDPNHCGRCNNACPSVRRATPICRAGSCGYTCMGPYLDCDRSPANGCEVDGRVDPANCGACGRTVDEVCDGMDNSCNGISDEGCPYGLRYPDSIARSPTFGAGTGGVGGTGSCPSLTVATGIYGSLGTHIHGLRLHCSLSELVIGRTTTPYTHRLAVLAPTSGSSGPGVASSTGPRFDYRCPDGHVLVGLRGQADEELEQITPLCAPVTLESEGPGTRVSRGPAMEGPTFGSGMAPPFAFEAPRSSEGASLVVGLEGSATTCCSEPVIAVRTLVLRHAVLGILYR